MLTRVGLQVERGWVVGSGSRMRLRGLGKGVQVGVVGMWMEGVPL